MRLRDYLRRLSLALFGVCAGQEFQGHISGVKYRIAVKGVCTMVAPDRSFKGSWEQAFRGVANYGNRKKQAVNVVTCAGRFGRHERDSREATAVAVFDAKAGLLFIEVGLKDGRLVLRVGEKVTGIRVGPELR